MDSKHIPNETNGFEIEGKLPINQRSSIKLYHELILRFIVLVTTIVAVILTGVATETEIVSISILPGLPPMQLPVTAKSKYLSANVFFMVSNAITCSHAAVSLILLFSNKKKSRSLELVINILDLIITTLLFSAIGAASGVGMIGLKGNSHLQWKKVCDVFGVFCRHLIISVVMSAVGASILVLLIVLSLLDLHKRSK